MMVFLEIYKNKSKKESIIGSFRVKIKIVFVKHILFMIL